MQWNQPATRTFLNTATSFNIPATFSFSPMNSLDIYIAMKYCCVLMMVGLFFLVLLFLGVIYSK